MIPFNPLSKESPVSLYKLQDEMNRMLDRLVHSGISTGPFDGQEWAPPVEVRESADAFTVMVELPGIDPGSLDVTCLGNAVTIRGTKTPPAPDEGQQTVKNERRFGTFCRTLELGGTLQADAVSARLHNGVLMVGVPKTEDSRAKSIKIDVAQ